MTEAEILSIRNELTALVVSVASVSFSMITAYLVGLWLFLKNAPASLKVLAFALLTCGLGFMGALTTGLNALLLGTQQAWTKIATPATGIAGFGAERPEWLYGFTMYEAAALSGGVAFLAIYVALFWMTFFYRWPDHE